MSEQRWQSIFVLFERALDVEASQRSRLLDEACGGDTELRRGVEGMLEAHDQASLFFDRSEPAQRSELRRRGESLADQAAAAGRETPFMPQRVAELPGESGEAASDLPFQTVGPYRVLRQIGQGGMSTVYLAVRDDDAYRRRVVVKVVRRDMQSRAMLSRLRAERQILASLEHPNIARLYDGGSTAQGIPYFIMEHVEGIPIDRYCTQHQLSVEERLALFCKVCVAVQYAHQNLVVHRDIKPSNILVTADGEPKLLDFGIAKLLNPGMAGSDIEPTAAWQRLMTPSFASPEQIRGELVTTVSDVYSLGVLLYVLLTGRLPHTFEGRSLREIERLLTETEPLAPSRVATDAITLDQDSDTGSNEARSAGEAEQDALLSRSRRVLAGDVDAIVLKALRTSPSRRYASVGRFAADVDRFLSGLPVEARGGTWRYRAGKFARRHRTAVVSSSVAAVLLISAAVALALQNRRVVGERDKKSQVVSLFRDVFALSNPFVVPDAELTAREALERSLPLIEAGLQDQPDVRAELLYTTGSILRILGAVPEAIDHLGEALEIRRRLHGEGHLEVAAAMTELASAHREAGQMDVAEDLALQAVAAVREEVGDRHVALLDPLVQLVAIYCRQERWDEAAPIGEEVLVLTDELGANVRGKIIVLESLAKASSARGDYARAVELNREALGLARERYGADHPQHIATLNNIGLQLRRQEDFAGADQAYSEALRIQKLAYGEEGADAFLLNNIAGVRFAAGDYETAESIYREALDLVLDRLGREHWQAFALGVRITRCLTLQGDAVAAEQHIRQVLAEGALAAEHWRWDEARSVLGESLSAQGRCEEAEPLLVESFENIVEKRQRIRNRDDAFQRLRVHLESCGKAEDVERYAAMVES